MQLYSDVCVRVDGTADVQGRAKVIFKTSVVGQVSVVILVLTAWLYIALFLCSQERFSHLFI